MGQLGLTEWQTSALTKAFADFKAQLEDLEYGNASLVMAGDDQHFRIAPFGFPQAWESELYGQIKHCVGVDDWRAKFIITAFKKSSYTSGLGKYTQEIALEPHKDASGGDKSIRY